MKINFIVNIIDKFNKFIVLLDAKQQKQFWQLQKFSILKSISEVFHLICIWKFIDTLIGSSPIKENEILFYFYQLFGFTSEQNFIVAFFFLYLGVLLINTIIDILALRFQLNFINFIGYSFGYKLLRSYLSRDYLYHITNNSVVLTKRIITESQRLTNQVIKPIINFNTAIVFCIFIITTLIVINPIPPIIFLIVIGFMYIFIYLFLSKKIYANGKKITKLNATRQKYVKETLEGIKEIMLSHNYSVSANNILKNSSSLGKTSGANVFMANMPVILIKFALMLAVACTGLIIFLYSNDIEVLIPIVSLYIIAIFKLMPVLQKLYQNIASIKGNIHGFWEIKKDLDEAKIHESSIATEHIDQKKQILMHEIKLNNISFTFPGNSAKTLNNISLTIPKNHSIAFVGSSGAGKSTLFDVLLGLLPLETGSITIDGKEIDQNNIISWQKNISYVAQEIYLIDGSIAENIALGAFNYAIDRERIKEVIRLAQLEPMMQELEDGIDTFVGERGIKLSGGQRQRIGIARALYKNTQVLLLDEATNALDGVTEKSIMKTIQSLANEKTIITIAHRINTIKHYDTIYVMDKGQIVASGTHDQLAQNSTIFQKLIRLS